MLPKSKIPVFYTWDIGTYKGEYRKEDKHYARIDMSLEFAHKTVIPTCSHFVYVKTRTNLDFFSLIERKKMIIYSVTGVRLSNFSTGKFPIRLLRTKVLGLKTTSSYTQSSDFICTYTSVIPSGDPDFPKYL